MKTSTKRFGLAVGP